ncbi:Signal transduction histidine kinase [Thalassobacillus cyri]|uniref:histidine kinase n=1 Tax=Thalassobacillus cyri TaxID=571932 RepID=A0A1H4G7Q0_9BACI|nr:HAMP domain-containing sensor histidine kinase [Thalassobacillus cyri]SEB05574.1 Signal transduction histidine kinase [Thalassobacillus cyri]
MNKIVLKLGGTIMALFLVVLLPLGYVANQIFTNFYYNQVQEEISDLSQKYALTLPSLNNDMSVQMFQTLAELTNKEIYIVDAEGKVVTDSGLQLTNLSREDIQLLSEGQSVQKTFHNAEANNNYLGSGHPIVQSDGFQGAFFVLAPINDIQEPVEKIRDLLILSAVGALFLALGFTFLLSKTISGPLLEIEQATRDIAKGNLDIRVDIPSNDEIGSLGKAINDLAIEINRYRSNRSEFFANVSHELRTPITYMKGYAQVLKQNLYQTEEERLHYLTIIESETERMVGLINDLFDLSKMEEGKFDLHMTTLHLTDVLESAFFKVKMEFEQKGILLNSYFEENVPAIEADGDRLEQIFINLLGNAARYTERGAVNVQVWHEDNQVNVVIEDTGIGIPEEELSFVFDRFHRVEKSRSRELGGTGLGLAIVKHLVDLQNGSISVSSQVGKGTRFQLSFPQAE